MDHKNPILDSVLKIAGQELKEDFILCYDKSKTKLGDKFETVMQKLEPTIIDMQKDCKPGTTVVEVVMLMIMTNIDEYSDEEKQLNDFLKACAIWMLKSNPYQ